MSKDGFWAFVWRERFCGINSAFLIRGKRVVRDLVLCAGSAGQNPTLSDPIALDRTESEWIQLCSAG